MLVLEREFNRPAEENRIQFVVYPYRQVDCCVQFVCSLQCKVAQMAGLVVILFIRSPELPVAAILEEHAGEIENCLLVCQNSIGDIPLVERIE